MTWPISWSRVDWICVFGSAKSSSLKKIKCFSFRSLPEKVKAQASR